MDNFITIALSLVIVLVMVVLFLIFLLVRKYRLVRRPETPFSTKFAFWSSLAYTIFPLDLLPDPIYLDDVGVLLGGLIYVSTSLRKHYGRVRLAERH